jgi:hypothetical protein
MNITKKDLTSSLGLILMFTLGWITNDLVSQMSCDDKVEREQMRQRMNRYDFYREPRWDMPQYDQQKQRWNRKQDKTTLI